MSSEFKLSMDSDGLIIIENPQISKISLHISLKDKPDLNAEILSFESNDGKKKRTSHTDKPRICIIVEDDDIEKKFVKPLIEDLKKNITCFLPNFPNEDIELGTHVDNSIQEIMNGISKFLVLLSLSYYKKSKTKKYLKIACNNLDEFPDNMVVIIPIRLEDIDLPPKLNQFQFIDLFPSSNYNEVFGKILRAINKVQEVTIEKKPKKQ